MHFTDAIALSKIPLGEADMLFFLYTKDFGKIRARAQGVKKPEAKLRGHLEAFNAARVGFIETRKGERLIYAEAIEVWPRIREDFDRTSAASYFTALLDHSTFPGERDGALWEHLYQGLRSLEENGPSSELYKNFEDGLLAKLGYGGAGDISILGLPVARPV